MNFELIQYLTIYLGIGTILTAINLDPKRKDSYSRWARIGITLLWPGLMVLLIFGSVKPSKD